MTPPARAALLSSVVPGWGQFRAGRRRAGVFFLAAEGCAWLLSYLWIPFPILSPLLAFVGGFLLLALRPAGALQAVRAAGGEGLTLFAVTTSFLLLFAQQAAASLTIKLTAYEFFQVASSSHEPTLMGGLTLRHSPASCQFPFRHVDAEADRVVVSKLAYSFGEVRRWDSSVFRFPLRPSRTFIKRVVGMPGEELMIQAGEIWTRAPGQAEFRIARKPLESQETAWVDLDLDTLRDRAAFVPAWTMKGSSAEVEVVDGVLKAPAEVRYSWSQPIIDGRGSVDDRLISFEASAETGTSRLFAEIHCSYGRFEAAWSVAGPGELAVYADGVEGGPPRLRVEMAGRLSEKRFHRLALAVTDGRAVAWLDGAVAAQLEFLQTSAELPKASDPGTLTFGTRGGASRIRRLRPARDLQWNSGRFSRDGEIFSVPTGSYYVLGDNAESSHDSRGWTRVSATLPGGRKAYYEAQVDEDSEAGIAGVDESGAPVLIPPDAPEIAREPFRFIPRDAFVGRVFRVWWPLARARPIH